MRNIRKYISGSLAIAFMVILGSSCKKEMVSINTNPNSLPDVKPEYLFTGATVDINLTGRTQLINRYTFMQYMQYIVPDGINAGLENAYWVPGAATGPAPGLTYYKDYYNGVGVSMHRIIEQIDAMPEAEKASYANLKAICRILDTYEAWRVADVYGAMPYSQAFNEAKYPKPSYDYNWDLYKTFDAQLKEAATVLHSNAAGQVELGNQDFFYEGDIPSWEAFANTLRIKIAQRYGKRDAANLASVLSDIETNFDGRIISGNDQSFGYNHTQSWDNNVDDINTILLDYNAAYPFVEFLKSTDDPRLALMVRQNDWGANAADYNDIRENGTAEAIKTLDSAAVNTSRFWGKHTFPDSQDPDYGWTGAGRSQTFNLKDGTSTQLAFLSAVQTRLFLKNGGFGGFDARSAQSNMHSDETYVDGNTIKMRTLYLPYSETCFMMAEIAAKGGNGLGKTAAEWYNDGVQASFDQYKAAAIAGNVPGADTVQIGDYLARYPYSGLESIYSQAWVNFLVEPEEAWAMWKRTGYPQFTGFTPGQASKIGDGSGVAYLEALKDGSQTLILPRRAAFTINNAASTLNSDNFSKALQDMIAKDPAYGTDGLDAKGRIWWDTK